MQNLSGQIIKGYELREQIGSGGFGAVYRAYQPSVKREVAIKVILPEHASRQDFVYRFEVEAQTIARMEHPYIVPLYDFWQDAQGAFLVMRLLPSSLREALKSGPWEAQATARLLDQIAGALSVAHRAGIVHRDIKPDNILLDEDSNAFLTDFGIAKDLSAEDATQEGMVVGSPAYLTPEQIKGEKVTPASDIYSLGLVVYEMLAGSKPYADSTTPAELLYKHLNQSLPPLNARRDTLPAALNQVLQTATAKASEERYASAPRFADAFQAALPVTTQAGQKGLPEPLTERELDILTLMVEGLSNKDIAAKLYLTLSTVRWFVQQIYIKLDAHSRAQAIERAKNLKLLEKTTEEPSMKKTNAVPNVQSKPIPHVAKALTTEQRNRQRMLEKVRAFWVEGVLENSLHGATLMELGMKERAEAVERAWDIVLQQSDQADRPLPHGTRIADVFDEMDGELLILGEPGSGKTTTLLELARDLLTTAQEDERQPMPTVFNLSSWAASRKPIQEWLVDELNSKYQIPRKVGQAWVEADQILPLLDGLDEVKQDYRAACVEAINTWRQEHGFLPVVVCSRITDYEALSVRLRLHTAIVLQPLTVEQINQSLAGATEDLSGLRSALHSDKSLQSLLKTPLMLSIVTLTYRDMEDKSIFTTGSPEARNAQIFDTYIAHALRRRGKNQPYKPEQTVRWLSWLAKKQQESGQTVFYIENMQPRQFLTTRLQRFLFAAILGLPGLIVMLMFGGSIEAPAFILPWWLSVILLVWFSFGKKSGSELPVGTSKRLPFTWKGLSGGIGRGLLVGVLGGAVSVLYYLMVLPSITAMYGTSPTPYGTGNPNIDLLGNVVFLAVWGASLGIVYGIADGVTSRRRYRLESDIKVADAVQWQWREHLRSVLTGVVAGAIVGMIPFYFFNIAFFLSFWPKTIPFSLGALLLLPLQVYGFLGMQWGAVGGGLLGLLFGGAVSREVVLRTRPNEGMWRTARNAVRSSLIRGAIFGIPVAVINILTSPSWVNWTNNLPGLVVWPIALALVLAVVYGGIAVIKHIILRMMLAFNGNLPLNLARFLDYSADVILLRKVGGGYVYIHRMLLEHFAAMAPGLAFQKSKRKRLPGQAADFSQPALATSYPNADGEKSGEDAPIQEDETLLGEQKTLNGAMKE